MKIIKNKVFLTLLLLTPACTVYTMDEPPKKTSKTRRIAQWAMIAGDLLLGNIPVQKIHLIEQTSEPFAFTELPKELQNTIKVLLLTGATAKTLNEVAFTITSLAQVNRELNELINGPTFCLQIIKSLSKRFDCPDFDVCLALQIKQAKSQYELQKKLLDLCIQQKEPNQQRFALLCYQGVDLEFTYSYDNHIATPLMIASLNNNFMIGYLLNAGANVNQSNPDGITALMLTSQEDTTRLAMNRLIISPDIVINQQDKAGNTALMYALINNDNIKNLQRLLDKKADPELPNSAGITPLMAAQQTGDKAIITLIQNAIDTKHGRK
ncbi:MAG TPA: ankyrin repeat domain-containing protein [Candidatus Babeliales bacterium]|nr:ankyrin repeat domain-containing protein [Candidatus Babeliales bacterium]